MIEVQKIKTEKALQEAFAIRHNVFVIEQVVDAEEEYDEFDKKCTHFIAYFNKKPAGTARWRFKTEETIKLERFAVESIFRNKGIGAALVQAVLNDLPYCKMVMMHAQLHAVAFYEKQGFEIYGPQFEEAGIQHFAMKLKSL